jgi:uncharacterized membrane protein YdjX (TVP38/TMEM64 family)
MPLPPLDLRRRWRALRELGAVGPLALLAVFGPLVGALVLAGSAGLWFEPLRASGLWAVPTLGLGTVFLAGLSLLPTHATSLLAGILFGAVGGPALALVSIAGAALLGFAALRHCVGDRLVQEFARRPRAAAVHRALCRRSASRTGLLIALIRLSPAMPFAVTNLLMASAGVPLRTFLVGTLLGIAPRVLVVAWAGAGLRELDLSQGRDARLLIAGAVALVLALVVVGVWSRNALREAVEQTPSI